MQNNELQKQFGLIAIGVSTGGPNALLKIFREIRKVKVPIVIVQHIAGNFPEMLVESLNRISPIHFKVAEEGEQICANTAYLSKSERHLTLVADGEKKQRYRVHYTNTAPVKSCKPSVDVLFESLADVVEHKMLVFVLTGMGNDGLDGVKKIKAKNKRHVVVCQDQETSVVYGMNRSVVEANLADKVMALDRISSYLTSLVGEL